MEMVQHISQTLSATHLASTRMSMLSSWYPYAAQSHFSLLSLCKLYQLHNQHPEEIQSLQQTLTDWKTRITAPFSFLSRAWIRHAKNTKDEWGFRYKEAHHLDPFSYPHMQVARLLRFSPTQRAVEEKKRILLLITHGTILSLPFTQKTPRFYGEREPLYGSIKHLAQEISTREKTDVDVLILRWNGTNSNEARIEAGTSLAQLVDTHFPASQYEDYWVGISHGSNVNLWALQLLENSPRTLKKIVMIATPYRADFPIPRLQGPGIVYNFYNPWDMVQYFGSFEVTTRESSHQSPVHPRRLDPSSFFSHTVHNFQVKFDERNPSHPEMKYLLYALPNILHRSLDPTHLHFKLHVQGYYEHQKTMNNSPQTASYLDIDLTPDAAQGEVSYPEDHEEDVMEIISPF